MSTLTIKLHYCSPLLPRIANVSIDPVKTLFRIFHGYFSVFTETSIQNEKEIGYFKIVT